MKQKKIGLNINSLSLMQEIDKKIGEKVLETSNEEDSTDGPLTFIENLVNNLQAEFDETIGSDGEKKLFITSLTRIFAILLSTRADTAEKKLNKGCR